MTMCDDDADYRDYDCDFDYDHNVYNYDLHVIANSCIWQISLAFGICAFGIA